jgi:hypothetical protein
MANEIRPGDIVELKSGSPSLTVLWITQEEAGCMFYNHPVNAFSGVIRISLIALKPYEERAVAF